MCRLTCAQASLDTISVAQQELSSLREGRATYVQVGRVFFKKPAAACAQKLQGDVCIYACYVRASFDARLGRAGGGVQSAAGGAAEA